MPILIRHPAPDPALLFPPSLAPPQRRTSMRITAVPRRRSSVVYNPGSLLQSGGAGGLGPAYTPPQEAAEEGMDGAAPMDTDVNEMTPEEIESMIRKLQVG